MKQFGIWYCSMYQADRQQAQISPCTSSWDLHLFQGSPLCGWYSTGHSLLVPSSRVVEMPDCCLFVSHLTCQNPNWAKWEYGLEHHCCSGTLWNWCMETFELASLAETLLRAHTFLLSACWLQQDSHNQQNHSRWGRGLEPDWQEGRWQWGEGKESWRWTERRREVNKIDYILNLWSAMQKYSVETHMVV